MLKAENFKQPAPKTSSFFPFFFLKSNQDFARMNLSISFLSFPNAHNQELFLLALRNEQISTSNQDRQKQRNCQEKKITQLHKQHGHELEKENSPTNF